MNLEILCININNFLGPDDNLMEHKNKNGNIDWSYLEVCKNNGIFDKFKNYVNNKCPDILILNEMPCTEFDGNLLSWIQDNLGYKYFKQSIPKFNSSITCMFYNENTVNSENKEKICCKFLDPNKEELTWYRTSQFDLNINSEDDIKIIGVHFPFKRDDFLEEFETYCKKYKDDKIIIIGDFNANKKGTSNKNTLETIINDDNKYHNLRTENEQNENEKKQNQDISDGEATFINKLKIDYAIVSNALWTLKESKKIEIDYIIDPDTINNNITDHNALIVELKF